MEDVCLGLTMVDIPVKHAGDQAAGSSAPDQNSPQCSGAA